MQAMAAAQTEGQGSNPTNAGETNTSPQQAQAAAVAPRGPRHPWETVEEIVAILKTAFPLLALTLETMVDQFAQRFKATQEEELVRYFNALLMEALNVRRRFAKFAQRLITGTVAALGTRDCSWGRWLAASAVFGERESLR